MYNILPQYFISLMMWRYYAWSPDTLITLITRYQAMRGKMNELVRVLDELKQVIKRESLDNDHDQNESEKVI